MTADAWLALVGTITLVVLAPGPSVALVWAHRVRYGPRATLPTIAGDLSANMLQLAVAWAGLGGLRELGFGGRVVGGVCVVWLGWEGMRQILTGVPRRAAEAAEAGAAVEKGTLLFWYGRGFAVSAANPKAIFFFLGLLPAALAGARVDAMSFLTVAATFAALDGTALGLYAFGGGRARAWLLRRGRAHWEPRLAGSLLLAAAALMAVRVFPG